MQWRIQDFPRGAPTSKSAIFFQIFCRKMHENERIWIPGTPPWSRQWYVKTPITKERCNPL